MESNGQFIIRFGRAHKTPWVEIDAQIESREDVATFIKALEQVSALLGLLASPPSQGEVRE